MAKLVDFYQLSNDIMAQRNNGATVQRRNGTTEKVKRKTMGISVMPL
jgi:hypothetical protein